MKMRYLGISILIISLFFTACEPDGPGTGGDDLDSKLIAQLLIVGEQQGIRAFQLPEDGLTALIPQDPRNPITPEKVELGKLLFHETGLGSNPLKVQGEYTYSCASCHHVAAGFQAGVIQGIGEGGFGFGTKGEGRVPMQGYSSLELDVQPIRSPATLNVAWQELMLWNGQFGATGDNIGTEQSWTFNTPKEANFLGYHGLETQAVAGLGVHRMEVDSTFIEQKNYKALFDAAFPQEDEYRRYTKITAGLAMAAYERTLMANQAPFQKWLAGDLDAMTSKQKEGALLFFGEANCVSCHKGPALNSMEFYALGMNDLPEVGTYGDGVDEATRLGRGGFTNNPQDNYKFKVPQLYNLKDSKFYGHGGSFTRLRDVVSYKNSGRAENTDVPAQQLAIEFGPLGLMETDIDAITEFLSEALYDPDLSRYVPAQTLSGLCFPNNDSQSQQDLGCQ